jgi:hypothetical protein
MDSSLQARHLASLAAGMRAFASGTAAVAPSTARFVAQTFAAAASMTSTAAIEGFLAAAIEYSHLPTGLWVSVELISGMASECLQRPHVHRDAVATAIVARVGEVLDILERALRAPEGAVCPPSLPADWPVVGDAAGAVMHALGGLTGSVINLALLLKARPALFAMCFSCLASGSDAVQYSSSETLVELTAACSRDRAGSKAFQHRAATMTSPEDAVTALDLGCRLVGALRPAMLRSLGRGEEAAQSALCRVAQLLIEERCSFHEFGFEASSGAIKDCLALLFSAMDSDDLAVKFIACEAWPALMKIPPVERGPSLSGGMFQALFAPLMRGLSMPEDFVSWDRSGEWFCALVGVLKA